MFGRLEPNPERDRSDAYAGRPACLSGTLGGVKLRRASLLLSLVALAITACNIQPQAFANGSTQQVGTVSVALSLQPNPPRAGQPSKLVLTLQNGDQPVGAAPGTCEVVLDMPKMPMNMAPMSLDSDADGHCQASYPFPMAGGWSATVRVRGQEGAQGQASFAFDVGP